MAVFLILIFFSIGIYFRSERLRIQRERDMKWQILEKQHLRRIEEIERTQQRNASIYEAHSNRSSSK